MEENFQFQIFNDSDAFIECSNTMDDFYENIDDYKTNRQRKILIVFDNMTADIMTSKKTFQSIIKELFIRCRCSEYFTCVYHSILIFCSKRCHIKFDALFDYEN